MSEGREKIYEMFWDCPYCGSIKLLGKTHRHCPVCGAAQDPDVRYFPPDDEKVAVQDHVYYGADRVCESCGEPNSARSRFCAGCGSPLEGASEASLVRDPGGDETTAKRPAAAKKSKKGLVVGLIIGGIVLLLVAAAAVLLLWKQTVAISVAGHTWSREMQIEDFAPRSRSEWCDRMPADASKVTRKREVRSYKKVPDGKECTTSRKDKGDGTYSSKKKCKTKYRKEPVYGQKCYFTVNRWEYSRSVTARGRSLAEAPVWPRFELGKTGRSIGAEREGRRIEKYTVHFTGPEGMTAACDFPQNSWAAFQVNSQWDGEAGVVTGVLDCSTLRPHGSR